MAFGVICSCCGQKGERPESTAPDAFFTCAPCQEDPASGPPDMSVHTIPVETGTVRLEAAAAFEMLSPKEQAYALAVGRASWEGAKICLLQCSAESVPIFSLLQLVFSAEPVAKLTEAAVAAGLSEEEVSQGMMYVAAFYGNLGNYKSFGDTKFVPEIPAERFKLLLTAGAAAQTSTSTAARRAPPSSARASRRKANTKSTRSTPRPDLSYRTRTAVGNPFRTLRRSTVQ